MFGQDVHPEEKRVTIIGPAARLLAPICKEQTRQGHKIPPTPVRAIKDNPMPGTIKNHMLVYTVMIAGFLTVLFDINLIASLGAFFYLVMDIIIDIGVFGRLREKTGARRWVLMTTIVLDAMALAAFAETKSQSNPLIVVIGIVGMTLVFVIVRVFLARSPVRDRRSRPPLKMA
ncbi:MAG: hypothetical protein CVT86_00320 [Alphaproteobacteria bacterium HGW-Alphaproteobacteria-8]|nr:MAG: hypothetical protein CVT86_00320 [Alphaproteobacteria bacterium HGW-Alphaproteobacteria-8]